jgi:hypothetical protein
VTVPAGVVQFVTGSNGVAYPELVGNYSVTLTFNNASGPGPLTLFTGSPFYYITRFYVTVDPTCSIASAGMVNIQADDSVIGILGRTRVYLPASSPTYTVPTPALISDSGAGFFGLSTTANSVATVTLSQALLTGQIRVTANYGFIAQANT